MNTKTSMHKPVWRNLQSATAMHSAMTCYARTLDRPNYQVVVKFSDGSAMDFEFEPYTKEVKYIVGSGDEAEDYYQTVDTASYDAGWLIGYEEYKYHLERDGTDLHRVTKVKLKKLFKEWMDTNSSEYTSITWKEVTNG